MAQYNVGRQRVVDCWSSNRERALSELGTDTRGTDGQQRSAGVTSAERIGLAGVATVSISLTCGGVAVDMHSPYCRLFPWI